LSQGNAVARSAFAVLLWQGQQLTVDSYRISQRIGWVLLL